MDRAWELARLLASGPPLVFACIKETVRMTENVTTQEAFNMLHNSQIPAVRTLYDSDDQLEGSRAFAEKRDPVWKGR
jgi:crotonobetainyl-CoA hydratase